MIVPFLILGLGAYLVLIVWRARVEDGRVIDEDAFAKFAAAMRDLNAQIGAALLPAITRTTAAFERFSTAFSVSGSEDRGSGSRR